jgi:cytochrome c oxidase cbb3-type subunit III
MGERILISRIRHRLGGVGKFRLFVTGLSLSLVLLVAAIALLVRHEQLLAQLVRADPDTVSDIPALRSAAVSMGRPVYRTHCAGCHGADGEGKVADGVPDLRDHDWLYGEGRVSEIEGVVRYGIRARNSKGWNLAAMPAYASLRPYAAEPIPPLTPGEVSDVVQLLLRYEARASDSVASARGAAVYQKGGCWDCHGPDGYGDPAIGAPNLRDTITLYGGSRAALTRTVEQGRHGVSPAFADRLDPAQIRAVAVYVASLSHSGSSYPVKALP